jgi:3-hydroxyisobutyrate dehydrogenase-like beta-hydroxyacid dehydrogenase
MMERIGFLGLGIMGGPMTRNLLQAGFAVTVFDPDATKVAAVAQAGAQAAPNAAAVARQADVVVACLPSAAIVEQAVAGPGGILEGCRDAQVFVDTTTSYPAASQRVAALLAPRGVAMLDAPVSGGNRGAEEGTLSIMVGGPATAFQRCLPVLEAMGQRITLIGEQVGAGGYAKLTNQIMVSIHLASVAEAFTFAQKAGLDLARLVPALEAGWANSKVLNVKAPKILTRDYSPTGTVRIQHKDLSYINRTAADLGLELQLSPQIQAMYQSLIDAGQEGLDQMALIKIWEQAAGVEVGA